MPSRMLNVCAMMFVPLLLGLCAAYRHRAGAWAVAALLAAGLLVSDRSAFGGAFLAGAIRTLDVDPLDVIALAAVGIIAVAWYDRRARAGAAGAAIGADTSLLRIARGLTAALLAVAALSTAATSVRHSAVALADFRDRTNDRVFAQLAMGSGFVASGGDMQLVQLKSRRAVLIDGGGLDGLPYAIDTAPAVDRILRDVYGIDLFHPPADARFGGRVPPGSGRATWEGFSLERWQEIRRTYRVIDVVTPADWQLQLPAVAITHGVRLYVIPE